MDVHQVTLELSHHLTNLLKVSLVKSRLFLVRRTLLESVVGQSNSGLESYTGLDLLFPS